MIDQLLEKYLTAFKPGRHSIEIFINPSKSEMNEILKAEGGSNARLRFIADSKKKVVYVWNAGLQIHNRTWSQLYDEGMVDERVFYDKPRYISGEFSTHDGYDFQYAYEYSDSVTWEDWDGMDWSWLEKILGHKGVGIKDAMQNYKEDAMNNTGELY